MRPLPGRARSWLPLPSSSHEAGSKRAGRPLRPRRSSIRTAPIIDDITWECYGCRDQGRHGVFRRVDDVIDAWFDSGAMPFAQHHYPFENAELDRRRTASSRPADFISEAIDQTRGWFYTLHVLACALFDSVAFEHCIVMGHVNDDQGRKMSKRLGNVVDPMGVIAETGADALRWYFYVNDPEQTSRFSAQLVREAAQGLPLPIWNALSFFTIYANLDGWHPRAERAAIAYRRARRSRPLDPACGSTIEIDAGRRRAARGLPDRPAGARGSRSSSTT